MFQQPVFQIFSDNDWQGFCEYNIQDVNIIVELEEKITLPTDCKEVGIYWIHKL